MAAFRSDWLTRTDAAVERLTDDLAAIDVRGSRFLLQEFLTALDAPPDALHGAVLSTILMDVCGRVVLSQRTKYASSLVAPSSIPNSNKRSRKARTTRSMLAHSVALFGS